MEKTVNVARNYHYIYTMFLCIMKKKQRRSAFAQVISMRVYKNVEENILEMAKCNKCGKEILVKNGIIKDGVFSINYDWGYFSEKDGETHCFDLCEECYDKLINSFVIEPDININNELL